MASNKMKNIRDIAAGSAIYILGVEGVVKGVQDLLRDNSTVVLTQGSGVKIDPNTIITYVGPTLVQSQGGATGAQMTMGVTSAFNDLVAYGGSTVLTDKVTEQMGTIKVTLENIIPIDGGSSTQATFHLMNTFPPELQIVGLAVSYGAVLFGAYLIGRTIIPRIPKEKIVKGFKRLIRSKKQDDITSTW